MEDLTAIGRELMAVLALCLGAAAAGPRVVWLSGAFGIEYDTSLRWPPDRPENLDRRYRYDARQTKFQTILGGVGGVGITQLLWSAHPWWVFAAAWTIAGLRSAWTWRLTQADGGLSRPRNPIEQILLWTALAATLLIDLTVLASTALHLIR